MVHNFHSMRDFTIKSRYQTLAVLIEQSYMSSHDAYLFLSLSPGDTVEQILSEHMNFCEKNRWYIISVPSQTEMAHEQFALHVGQERLSHLVYVLGDDALGLLSKLIKRLMIQSYDIVPEIVYLPQRDACYHHIMNRCMSQWQGSVSMNHRVVYTSLRSCELQDIQMSSTYDEASHVMRIFLTRKDKQMIHIDSSLGSLINFSFKDHMYIESESTLVWDCDQLLADKLTLHAPNIEVCSVLNVHSLILKDAKYINLSSQIQVNQCHIRAELDSIMTDDLCILEMKDRISVTEEFVILGPYDVFIEREVCLPHQYDWQVHHIALFPNAVLMCWQQPLGLINGKNRNIHSLSLESQASSVILLDKMKLCVQKLSVHSEMLLTSCRVISDEIVFSQASCVVCDKTWIKNSKSIRSLGTWVHRFGKVESDSLLIRDFFLYQSCVVIHFTWTSRYEESLERSISRQDTHLMLDQSHITSQNWVLEGHTLTHVYENLHEASSSITIQKLLCLHKHAWLDMKGNIQLSMMQFHSFDSSIWRAEHLTIHVSHDVMGTNVSWHVSNVSMRASSLHLDKVSTCRMSHCVVHIPTASLGSWFVASDLVLMQKHLKNFEYVLSYSLPSSVHIHPSHLCNAEGYADIAALIESWKEREFEVQRLPFQAREDELMLVIPHYMIDPHQRDIWESRWDNLSDYMSSFMWNGQQLQWVSIPDDMPSINQAAWRLNYMCQVKTSRTIVVLYTHAGRCIWVIALDRLDRIHQWVVTSKDCVYVENELFDSLQYEAHIIEVSLSADVNFVSLQVAQVLYICQHQVEYTGDTNIFSILFTEGSDSDRVVLHELFHGRTDVWWMSRDDVTVLHHMMSVMSDHHIATDTLALEVKPDQCSYTVDTHYCDVSGDIFTHWMLLSAAMDRHMGHCVTHHVLQKRISDPLSCMLSKITVDHLKADSVWMERCHVTAIDCHVGEAQFSQVQLSVSHLLQIDKNFFISDVSFDMPHALFSCGAAMGECKELVNIVMNTSGSIDDYVSYASTKIYNNHLNISSFRQMKGPLVVDHNTMNITDMRNFAHLECRNSYFHGVHWALWGPVVLNKCTLLSSADVNKEGVKGSKTNLSIFNACQIDHSKMGFDAITLEHEVHMNDVSFSPSVHLWITSTSHLRYHNSHRGCIYLGSLSVEGRLTCNGLWDVEDVRVSGHLYALDASIQTRKSMQFLPSSYIRGTSVTLKSDRFIAVLSNIHLYQDMYIWSSKVVMRGYVKCQTLHVKSQYLALNQSVDVHAVALNAKFLSIKGDIHCTSSFSIESAWLYLNRAKIVSLHYDCNAFIYVKTPLSSIRIIPGVRDISILQLAKVCFSWIPMNGYCRMICHEGGDIVQYLLKNTLEYLKQCCSEKAEKTWLIQYGHAYLLSGIEYALSLMQIKKVKTSHVDHFSHFNLSEIDNISLKNYVDQSLQAYKIVYGWYKMVTAPYNVMDQRQRLLSFSRYLISHLSSIEESVMLFGVNMGSSIALRHQVSSSGCADIFYQSFTICQNRAVTVYWQGALSSDVGLITESNSQLFDAGGYQCHLVERCQATDIHIRSVSMNFLSYSRSTSMTMHSNAMCLYMFGDIRWTELYLERSSTLYTGSVYWVVMNQQFQNNWGWSLDMDMSIGIHRSTITGAWVADYTQIYMDHLDVVASGAMNIHHGQLSVNQCHLHGMMSAQSVVHINEMLISTSGQLRSMSHKLLIFCCRNDGQIWVEHQGGTYIGSRLVIGVSGCVFIHHGARAQVQTVDIYGQLSLDQVHSHVWYDSVIETMTLHSRGVLSLSNDSLLVRSLEMYGHVYVLGKSCLYGEQMNCYKRSTITGSGSLYFRARDGLFLCYVEVEVLYFHHLGIQAWHDVINSSGDYVHFRPQSLIYITNIPMDINQTVFRSGSLGIKAPNIKITSNIQVNGDLLLYSDGDICLVDAVIESQSVRVESGQVIQLENTKIYADQLCFLDGSKGVYMSSDDGSMHVIAPFVYFNSQYGDINLDCVAVISQVVSIDGSNIKVNSCVIYACMDEMIPCGLSMLSAGDIDIISSHIDVSGDIDIVAFKCITMSSCVSMNVSYDYIKGRKYIKKEHVFEACAIKSTGTVCIQSISGVIELYGVMVMADSGYRIISAGDITLSAIKDYEMSRNSRGSLGHVAIYQYVDVIYDCYLEANRDDSVSVISSSQGSILSRGSQIVSQGVLNIVAMNQIYFENELLEYRSQTLGVHAQLSMGITERADDDLRFSHTLHCYRSFQNSSNVLHKSLNIISLLTMLCSNYRVIKTSWMTGTLQKLGLKQMNVWMVNLKFNPYVQLSLRMSSMLAHGSRSHRHHLSAHMLHLHSGRIYLQGQITAANASMQAQLIILDAQQLKSHQRYQNHSVFFNFSLSKIHMGYRGDIGFIRMITHESCLLRVDSLRMETEHLHINSSVFEVSILYGSIASVTLQEYGDSQYKRSHVFGIDCSNVIYYKFLDDLVISPVISEFLIGSFSGSIGAVLYEGQGIHIASHDVLHMPGVHYYPLSEINIRHEFGMEVNIPKMMSLVLGSERVTMDAIFSLMTAVKLHESHIELCRSIIRSESGQYYHQHLYMRSGYTLELTMTPRDMLKIWDEPVVMSGKNSLIDSVCHVFDLDSSKSASKLISMLSYCCHAIYDMGHGDRQLPDINWVLIDSLMIDSTGLYVEIYSYDDNIVMVFCGTPLGWLQSSWNAVMSDDMAILLHQDMPSINDLMGNDTFRYYWDKNTSLILTGHSRGAAIALELSTKDRSGETKTLVFESPYQAGTHQDHAVVIQGPRNLINDHGYSESSIEVAKPLSQLGLFSQSVMLLGSPLSSALSGVLGTIDDHQMQSLDEELNNIVQCHSSS